MALTDLLSFQITDFAGGVKSLPVYIASGQSVATIQTIADAVVAVLDPAIDGQITQITVTLQLTIDDGAKDAPTSGNTVHEGALLGYSAEDTVYRHSYFIPSYENAGYAGNVVLQTGDYAALEAGLSSYVDKNGNQLVDFLDGERRFRK
jgi:hypothetical protein